MTLLVDATTVAGSWLRTISGIPANKINTVLPALDQWEDTGFVQINGTVGGTPHLDAPIRQPVVQVDTWACRRDSDKPPWDKASRLMELIMAACVGPVASSVMVPLHIGSDLVRLMSVYPVSEPHKPPQGLDTGDAASFARYTVDLQFIWMKL